MWANFQYSLKDSLLILSYVFLCFIIFVLFFIIFTLFLNSHASTLEAGIFVEAGP